MPEIIRLHTDNFDYLYMDRLDAMVEHVAPELWDRQGVNPALDELLCGAMAYAYKLKALIEEGTTSAAIVENKDLCTVEGLLVVTPNVEVEDMYTGRTVMGGVCVEAVCIGSGGISLGDLYYEAREIAAVDHADSASGNIFAVEKTHTQPKVEGLFKIESTGSREIKHAIGSALPQMCSSGTYRRKDNKNPTIARTEIMWLRTKRSS